jgi:hypothetical protein
MTIELRPHSTEHPLCVDDGEYDRLVKRKARGWSQCEDETEWLAKLHYLRQGLRDEKVTPDTFAEREWQLVQAWLRRWI